MGLLTEGINEVIATTSFNAAPMGIHYRDGRAGMVLFTGSHTARNIERDGWVVANFIHDPLLYVKTAFEDLPADAFCTEDVCGRTVHRLFGAEAWIAFSATVGRRSGSLIQVSLVPDTERIETVCLHPVNRGFNSIIDATVHATRYRLNRDPELEKLIRYHASIVRRCGGSTELAALEDLLRRIQMT